MTITPNQKQILLTALNEELNKYKMLNVVATSDQAQAWAAVQLLDISQLILAAEEATEIL